MYVSVKHILALAKESNTAVISFICMDPVMARTVVYAAQATHTPALVMLYPEHVTVQHTTGLRGFAEMVKELADGVEVPIGLHLDHDYTCTSIAKAIDSGFGSVMMDGSMHELERNIQLTKEVVELAHARGVSVEGEIGHVGIAANADNDNQDFYTKPDAAALFVQQTGVDALAISIGNAHGEYRQTPRLDIDRLDAIHAATDVPLVLHGGSGIPDDQLLVAFAHGIRKFNLGTDYLRAYFQAVSAFVQEYGKASDPVKVINLAQYAQERLQPYVEERLRTLCHF